MKYTVEVTVTEIYEVVVEADSGEEAEEKATDMEYSEMNNVSSTVEFFYAPVEDK